MKHDTIISTISTKKKLIIFIVLKETVNTENIIYCTINNLQLQLLTLIQTNNQFN